MNIGVIGAGFMGSMHARIVRELTGTTLAGIASKGGTSAQRLAGELGVRAYGSWRELLDDPAIDAVCVCTPTDSHADIACAALAAGKHAIVEFPACSKLSELDRMIEASARSNRVCAVAYTARYQSQFSHVFELARSGKLGSVSGAYISRRSSSVFASGDIVNNMVSQDIDWMVRLLGKPDSVSCANVAQASASFAFTYSDKVVVIEGATNMPRDYPFTTRHLVVGSAGSIDLSWRFTDHPEYTMEYATDGAIERVECVDYDPYRRELERIIRAIENGDAGDCDAKSAYEGAALSFKCREMMR